MDARITRAVEKYRLQQAFAAADASTQCAIPAPVLPTTVENFMTDQTKLLLTELRLCGESNHWRVDARYTGATKDDGDDAGKQQDKDDKKPASPEEIHLSILVAAGDRSVVDLQIDAMDRAIAFLQTTVNAARQERLKRSDALVG
jgi:hypothetical protein